MKSLFAAKLKPGDSIRVIAPATSLQSPKRAHLLPLAEARLTELGFKVSYSTNAGIIDDFDSSSIAERVADLHDAFLDPSINLVIAASGGFNSNQLLNHIDYKLIQQHPKLLCGFSDITALANSIYAKTNLVTYSGPNFFWFAQQHGFDYTLEYFKHCLMSDSPYVVRPASEWSDDAWFTNQSIRTFLPNEGYWVINPGKAGGTLVGGNQCTLNLLQGTHYMPPLAGSLVFLEDDYEAHVATIDRDLQSLIHQPDFDQVRGIVFGRFQAATGMNRALLTKIVKSKPELDVIPVIGNVDFGHTSPMITFPIGGYGQLVANHDTVQIEITNH